MNWLETHLETFVKPIIDSDGKSDFNVQEFLESESREKLQSRLEHSDTFTPEELTVIKNAWRSIKSQAKGRQILLPGRDVFIFEILARRENYPTVFMPECSRQSVAYISKNMPPAVRNCFLFDTGFAGSIPRNLRIENFTMLSSSRYENDGYDLVIWGARKGKDVRTQVFPRLSLSRHLALKIEQTPKYWESGRTRFNVVDTEKEEIYQPFATSNEVLRAARLTIAIYRNSAPRFINKHNPLEHSSRRW